MIIFTNEIGNKIKIKINKYKGIGTNAKSKEKISYKGIKISIIGPHSISENEITKEEAIHLYNYLGLFLKKTN